MFSPQMGSHSDKEHREKCLSKAQFLTSNIHLTLNSFEIWPAI